MIFKYKIHCVTENSDQYWELPDSSHPPTHCPNDTSHTVDLSSVAVVDSGPGPQEVITQYEKNDKDLKIACASMDVDATTGQAMVSIKVPGTPKTTDGRYVAGGTGFFNVADPGDRVICMCVVDVDNILGAGANTTVKYYTDMELDAANQGWFIPPKAGQIDIVPMGGYGFIPAGLYLQVMAQKVSTNKTGTFYANVNWGKKE